ncbi:DUF4942 domain-containing protein [Modicisalibacter coralii]|uniref:DUF4942 domain-containing protein n=1 Tax=Modicisalibacter coralii TaxID=2304602 RepID=UPI00100A533F|nr:DUF4942 domain-containing protein [Halomonas coralii]
MNLSTDTRGLSPPTSELDKLLENRERAQDLLTRAVEMIAEANDLTPRQDGRVRGIGLAAELRSSDWYGVNKPDGREKLVKRCMNDFDKEGWLYLLKASQLSQLMSKQDKDAYYEQLSKDPPPLNRESVIGTFTELFGNRHKTWRRGVVELFASLSGNYRSHDPFKVGKRLIIEHAFSEYCGWNFYRHADDQVDDLQRVIALIEGSDQPEDKLSNVVDRAKRAGDSEIDSGPLTLRWFRNGNLHIWINDEALIDRINEIIAEHYGATLANGRRAG